MLKTIKVNHLENADDFMIINASDFDSRIHTRYSSKKKSQPKTEETQAQTKPVQPTVSERRAQREQELYAGYDDSSLSWRDIAALAEPHAIEKPESGWRDAIPLIAAAEFPDASE